MKTLALQRALTALGYQPGPADSVFGRKTISAVKAFQADRGLVVDGIVGPKTPAALSKAGGQGVGLAVWTGGPFIQWYREAERRKGLQIRDNAELRKFLKSDGATLGDPAKLPWCGDLVETCTAITLPDEPMIENPYWARSWANFGVKCQPTLGCVLVFTRSSGGHVGFYAGEDKTYFSVLGGNQSNSISISRIAKRRTCRRSCGGCPPIVPISALAGTARHESTRCGATPGSSTWTTRRTIRQT